MHDIHHSSVARFIENYYVEHRKMPNRQQVHSVIYSQ